MYRNVSDIVAQKDQLGVRCDKDCFIFNVEDPDLPSVRQQLRASTELPWGRSKAIFNILLLRDAYNLFASRFKQEEKDRNKKWTSEMAVQRWAEHADEYLGNTSHLGKNVIKVNYNAWCTNCEYRRTIAKRLNLEFTDAGFNRVSHFGAGSSFDGLKYDQRASEMKVLERWRLLSKNKKFLRIFRHTVLIDRTERIFGKVAKL
jgi:hypothetical protein